MIKSFVNLNTGSQVFVNGLEKPFSPGVFVEPIVYEMTMELLADHYITLNRQHGNSNEL